MGFTLTEKEVLEWRELAFAAKPYRDDDEHYNYLDCPGDPARERASAAVRMLKRAGLWTKEDEKKAFG